MFFFYRDEGEFDVFNFMGFCIVLVKFFYRFLSLGGLFIFYIFIVVLIIKIIKFEFEEKII